MIIRTTSHLLGFFVFWTLMVAPCGGQEKQAPKESEELTRVSAGAEVYTKHCALCHGNDLKGTGPFPAPYRVPPDLTTLAKRHGGKFPEAYVSKVLHNGVTLPAHAPAEMPMWSTTSRLDKTQFDEWVKDLISYLKSRQRK